MNLLDNTPNQQFKFGTKHCVEVNDDTHGIYNPNSQIKFKTAMWKSSLCDYSYTCILVKRTVIITEGPELLMKQQDKLTKEVKE